MSFLFRRNKKERKSDQKRGWSINRPNDQREPIRNKKATTDYARPKSRDFAKVKQTSPAKQANKSLVTKINQNLANPASDAIVSHKISTSTDVTTSKNSNAGVQIRNKASEEATSEANLIKDTRLDRHDISSSVNENAIEADKDGETSRYDHVNGNNDKSMSVEDVEVQIHHPATADSLTSTTTKELESDLHLDVHSRVKRKYSITHSEKDALGTLDDVLRTFDFDDNLNEVEPTEKKVVEPKSHPFHEDPSHESISDFGESLVNQSELKSNSVSNSSDSNFKTPSSSSPQKQEDILLMPQIQPEPVYSEPIKKPKAGATTSSNYNGLDQQKLGLAQKEGPEKSPFVLPEKVEDISHEIKFSALRKTSPSVSLSKSLNKTDWASSTENPNLKRRPVKASTSPKRKPVEGNNDNFSLRRGQLSGPAPVNTDENYVEPPTDYDVATLSSFGKSMYFSDESFAENTWGSLTSSSSSGSRKIKKKIRPEALKLIEKRRSQQQDKTKTDDRQHDGLVNRSFRLIKEEREISSKKSLEGDEATQSDIEKEYSKIKSEADIWLENYERLRANSDGKTGSLNSNSGSPAKRATAYRNEQTPASKLQNGFPVVVAIPLSDTTQAVLNQTETVDGVQAVKKISASLATTATSESQTTTAKKKSKKSKPQKESAKVEHNSSSDDEDLIRLMETGVGDEDSNGNDSSQLQPQRIGYVPRALRMSFGQSWEGIRKDRREWKSREMKHVSTNASRKGVKSLSNRFDDQEAQVEMLF